MGIKRGEGDKKDYHKRSMSGDFLKGPWGAWGGREGAATSKRTNVYLTFLGNSFKVCYRREEVLKLYMESDAALCMVAKQN